MSIITRQRIEIVSRAHFLSSPRHAILRFQRMRVPMTHIPDPDSIAWLLEIRVARLRGPTRIQLYDTSEYALLPDYRLLQAFLGSLLSLGHNVFGVRAKFSRGTHMHLQGRSKPAQFGVASIACW